MEDTLAYESFSTGAKDARANEEILTVEKVNPVEVGFLGARCAALRAFDAFIGHARGRDECRRSTPHLSIAVA